MVMVFGGRKVKFPGWVVFKRRKLKQSPLIGEARKLK